MAIISKIGLLLTAEGGQQVQRELQGVGKSASDAGKSSELLSSAFSRLRGVFAGIGAGYLVKEFVATADAMTSVNARLKLATTSTQEYTTAQKDVYSISQRQGAALRETADLYARLADPVRKLGGTSREVAGITEALAASLRISGTTGAAAAGAITQFSQAMASGALRGDEFNSVNEAAPRLMQALETSLGKTRGELRQMAEQGKLTADVVGNALLGELDNLKRESASLPETVGTAFQKLQNELGLFIAGADAATGATGTLAKIIVGAAAVVGELSLAMSGVNTSTKAAADSFSGAKLAVAAIGTVLETLIVVGANVGYVLKAVGLEVVGLGQQAKAVLSSDLEAAKEIGRVMKAEAAANRLEIDRFSESVVGATQRALEGSKAFNSAAAATGDLGNAGNDAATAFAKLIAAQKAAQEEAARQAAATKAAAAAAKLAEQQAKAQAEAEKRLQEALSAKTAVTDESVKALSFYSDAIPDVLQLSDQERSAIDSAANEYDRISQSRADAAKSAAEWAQTIQSINDGLTDALMRSFESGKGFIDAFRTTLENAFKSLVLQPTIKAIMAPVTAGIGSLFGSGSAFAGQSGGGGFSLSNLGSMISSSGGLSGLMSIANGSLIGGLQTQLLGLGDFLATSSSDLLAGAGEFLQSNYAGLGSAAGAFGGFMAGRGLGQLIGNGYAISGSGNGVVNAGAALGTLFGGPIGGAIGGAIGGVANRLFGRKLKDSGIEGTLSTEGLDGNAFEFYKGGLFRSNKTKRSDLDPGLDSVFDAGLLAASATVRSYAEVLGLPVKAITGYSEQIKISFKDLSEEQIREKIAETLTSFQDNLANVYSKAIAQYTRAGENATQTLQRLTQLEVLSQTINDFGGVFSRVAKLGIDARESLISMAGGIEALLGKTADFVRLYYGADEQAALAAKAIFGNLSAQGINVSGLNTTAEYRALLESRDINDAQGQAQFVALLDNAAAFAEVARYLAEAGGTLYSLAQSAPASEVLQTLFDQQAATQEPLQLGLENVSATIQSSSDATVAAIERLREEVMGLRGDTGAVIANTAATYRQLSTWDDGGVLLTSSEGGA